ncbi:hypothetical protein NDR87_10700 [Nocardia sp. CDC159]|uniref:Uncharacterized protein n=1 Tax=Nocardia pulmonis TaxID=2951408 RepID=A0A9X2E482_9NOCA|nr:MULTISPECIES: hypothetical protein [Nocardia]MCM6773939.1 hypothetical protein [Nocardia pulmonis]MCM6786826.1 hypothetical protein [Nocardia sp. CDC159]
MPDHVGGKSFYTREEAEARGWKMPEHSLERTAELKKMFADTERDTPPLPEGTPTYLDSKNYRDDLVGTEFEGWTTDPATGEWRDAQGRPAYDATGQRIYCPDGDPK